MARVNPDVRVCQTEPVLDNSADIEESSDPKSKVVHAYRDIQFLSIVRNVMKRDSKFAASIADKTWRTLRRLKLKRDLSKAAKTAPAGSDMFEMAQFRDWCDKILADDEDSVAQLVAIDAAARTRVTAG